VREHIEKNGKPQKILFSYHGTPKRNLELGDPYYCLCIKTTRLVAEKLGLNKDDYMACFQSRFGYAEWLKPYTDETLKNLPSEGIKNIAILSPAFSADCLETLEELAVENRHTFMEAGGEHYQYIPALNDRADHVHALVQLIRQH
jgi:ferrochelatase